MKPIRILSLLIGLLIVPGIFACGSKRLAVSRGVQPSRFDPIVNLEETRAKARSGKLHCPFSDECNPAVAMISVVTDAGLERCSGVLISENEVMTNDHCVNKSVSLKGWETRRQGLPCKNSVFVHLAGTADLQYQDLECSEIVSRSGETGIHSVDYAIIRLNAKVIDRAPVKMSKRGFMDRESATIYRVQMERANGGAYDGSQNRLDCQASYSTFLYPALDSIYSPLMTYGDCAIQAGNSGSPILNQNGELSALVQGCLTVEPGINLEQDLAKVALDGSFGQVAIGTQTQCVPNVNPSRAQVCTGVLPAAGYQVQDFLTAFKNFDEAELPQLSSGWEWKGNKSVDPLLKSYFKKPVCTAQASFESFEMIYKKGINRYMQPEWRSQTDLGEKKLVFTHSGVSQADQAEYTNQEIGKIMVTACSSIVIGH